MSRVQSKMATVAQSLQRFGTGMSLGGAALGAPLVLAARQAAGFEDALLGMKGAAGLGVADVARLEQEAKRLASTMGASPTKIAQSFLELAKAGMSVDDVLAGAGRSAVEFAKVSGVDAQRSAVFMKTAMNTFGVSATGAADTLSAAADSSETSIEAMVESFSQIGSAGNNFNQSLFGVSQALAVLAKYGIVGEEAGTGLKTVLTKLVAPTDDAKEALASLGLSVADFRDQFGEMLGMQQIAVVFENAMNKLAQSPEGLMQAQAGLVDVFEQRGIKIISALADAGQAGFAKVGKDMQNALPVSQKFLIAMEGISGQLERLATGVELVSIGFGKAMESLKPFTNSLFRILELFGQLLESCPPLSLAISTLAGAMVALGTGSLLASFGVKALKTALAIGAFLTTPTGQIALLVLNLGLMVAAFADVEWWGMRLQSVFQKLGLWIQAAFNQNFFFNGLNDALKKVDDDFAKWEAGRKNKQGQQAPNAGGNAARPDKNRAPMEKDLLEEMQRKKALAAELAKEEADAEQDMTRAISQQTDAYFKAIKQAEEFGDAGKKASDEYFAGLAKLQGQLLGGILNTTSYTQAAEALGDQFSGQLEAMRDAEKNRGTGFGQTLGGFGVGGSAGGIGIGPELNPIADATKQTAVNTAATVAAIQRLAENGSLLAGGDKNRAAEMRDRLAADLAEMQKRAGASALDFVAAGKNPTAGIDVAARGQMQAQLEALNAFIGTGVSGQSQQAAASATAAADAMRQFSAPQSAAAAPMAAAVPAAAASAEAGTQITAGFLRLGEHMTRLRSTMAAAMAANNQLTAGSNALLSRIAYSMEQSGAYFK